MDRHTLADRIAETPLTPNGQEDPNPETNPLVAAYARFPRVRRIIDGSPHNTYDDVLLHSVTADTCDQVIRELRNQR